LCRQISIRYSELPNFGLGVQIPSPAHKPLDFRLLYWLLTPAKFASYKPADFGRSMDAKLLLNWISGTRQVSQGGFLRYSGYDKRSPINRGATASLQSARPLLSGTYVGIFDFRLGRPGCRALAGEPAQSIASCARQSDMPLCSSHLCNTETDTHGIARMPTKVAHAMRPGCFQGSSERSDLPEQTWFHDAPTRFCVVPPLGGRVTGAAGISRLGIMGLADTGTSEFSSASCRSVLTATTFGIRTMSSKVEYNHRTRESRVATC